MCQRQIRKKERNNNILRTKHTRTPTQSCSFAYKVYTKNKKARQKSKTGANEIEKAKRGIARVLSSSSLSFNSFEYITGRIERGTRRQRRHMQEWYRGIVNLDCLPLRAGAGATLKRKADKRMLKTTTTTTKKL